jgi:hypothetical protein
MYHKYTYKLCVKVLLYTLVNKYKMKCTLFRYDIVSIGAFVPGSFNTGKAISSNIPHYMKPTDEGADRDVALSA